MTGRLYTLRAIARELGLPESTVRYYRDTFAGFVPTTGRGRRRRYPPEALGTFRTIAEGFADNRSRVEIEEQLGNGTGYAPPVTPPLPAAPGPLHTFREDSSRELLSIVLDGERERREVMWQMAREIVRLGEAIERQHVVLGEMAHRIEQRADRTLPPPPAAPPPPPEGGELQDQVAALRQELQRERELVDRLRKSKLDIERRAAEAEAALEETGEQAAAPGIFRRRGKPPGG